MSGDEQVNASEVTPDSSPTVCPHACSHEWCGRAALAGSMTAVQAARAEVDPLRPVALILVAAVQGRERIQKEHSSSPDSNRQRLNSALVLSYR
jgi:hypothetical protein